MSMETKAKAAAAPSATHPYRERFETYPRLPEKGRSHEDILRELQSIGQQEDAGWQTGRVSGTFYHAGKDHFAFLNQVHALFSHVNLLQRDLCPSGTKFEAEIVAMTAHLLNAPAAKQMNPADEVVGAVTSGGSESIMLPILVYRERAKAERGITAPEMIVPSTAHPAFSKGAHYFGLKLIRVPVGPDFLADVEAMRAAITPNTVAIAGSSANYPHGLMDPLERLSALALEAGVGMHVDACYSGFLLPWLERLGYDVPPFDFRLPGVTSMSCDTHKWGYGPKGASVVLYRNRALRHYQYFAITDWAGGYYASPTLAGSRTGGIAAATWAAMVALGEEGYLEIARQIMKAAETICAGAASIPEIKIAGRPTFCMAFMSDVIDIYHVNDFLAAKGWRMNVLQRPPGFHFCVTRPQTQPGVAEAFVEDLRQAVAYAKTPPPHPSKTSAIYGGGAVALDPALVRPDLLHYLDDGYEL
ncbi:MAG: aminotransferase class V-fold PLP-dependent enzyme [Terriglobia bacterium]|jgi:glutamate/tyrosine decarboxylase-like PLP-dependent enzyme